jgi:hypothetical protein
MAATAAMQREAVALVVVAVLAIALIGLLGRALRLPAGDE